MGNSVKVILENSVCYTIQKWGDLFHLFKSSNTFLCKLLDFVCRKIGHILNRLFCYAASFDYFVIVIFNYIS